jgi:hypothetical protein
MNDIKIAPQKVPNLGARGSLRRRCVEVDCGDYERAARVIGSGARDGKCGRTGGCW